MLGEILLPRDPQVNALLGPVLQRTPEKVV
jgi:hypothetical protein